MTTSPIVWTRASRCDGWAECRRMRRAARGGCGPPHGVGVGGCRARRGARAAIVTGDEEFVVAELAHDLDLIERHGAEGIIDVVLAAVLGTDAVAVAAQIRRDHVEALGEPVGHLVPGRMGERVAVQQEQRRCAAAVAQANARAAGLDVEELEALEPERDPFGLLAPAKPMDRDRKSTRLNSSHVSESR